jgi:hypothetical protein
VTRRLRLKTTLFFRNELARNIELEYLPYTDISIASDIEPLKPMRQKSVNDSTSPIHVSDSTRDGNLLQSNGDDTTQMTSTSSHIYLPVIVTTNRKHDDQIVEYAIDSICVPPKTTVKKTSSLNNDDACQQLLEKYDSIENNTYQTGDSLLTTDHNHHTQSNAQSMSEEFNKTHTSIVMLEQCQTQYNVISSSTKRNEILLYNSYLKVLMVLNYDRNRTCGQRCYLKWKESLDQSISDVTYCESIDGFLLSTLDECRMYLLKRDNWSLMNLGQLTKDLRLRRFHCFENTIYCILENRYLVEYELDENNSCMKFIQEIKISDASQASKSKIYTLLDVTCNEDSVVVIYSNEHDDIHLRVINRRTLRSCFDACVDRQRHIERDYIRVESTNMNSTFVYLNGASKQLKWINTDDDDEYEELPTMKRDNKPTNICFLNNNKFAILYEEPYFLSFHSKHD